MIASYVYALRAPGSDVDRYIGTTQSPRARLSQHRTMPGSRLARGLKLMPVEVWAHELQQAGTPCEMVILGRHETPAAAAADEQERIAAARVAGVPLLNRTTDGKAGWPKGLPGTGKRCSVCGSGDHNRRTCTAAAA